MSRLLVRSFALAAAVHGVAWACSCLPDLRTAAEHLAEDELVVWGTVVEIPDDAASEPGRGCGGGPSTAAGEPAGSSFTTDVRLDVEEGFVGAGAGDVVTIRASGGSDCAVTMGVGERWLVLLRPDEAVSACNVSHPAEDGDPLLEDLRAASAR
jgi:hypothetical protein